jgi:hypothetical protein
MEQAEAWKYCFSRVSEEKGNGDNPSRSNGRASGGMLR